MEIEEVICKEDKKEAESAMDIILKKEPKESLKLFDAEDSGEITDIHNLIESVGVSQGENYKTCLDPGCSEQFVSRQEFSSIQKINIILMMPRTEFISGTDLLPLFLVVN